MSEAAHSPQSPQAKDDAQHEGRDDCFMDIDRMVNEGLGGGQVTFQNGLIDASATDTMDDEHHNTGTMDREHYNTGTMDREHYNTEG